MNKPRQVGIGIAALVVLSVGCAAPSTQWDARAAGAVRDVPQHAFEKLDKGSVDGIVATMDESPTMLEIGDDDRPLRIEGRENVKKHFGGVEDAMKHGLKIKTNVVKNDCTATGQVGYCVIEFDQSLTLPTGATAGGKYRATLVLRNVNGEWRWTHYHASIR